MSYLTPEETAQQLKVEATEIIRLIEQGKLRAIKIGDNIRIPQPEVEKLVVTSPAGPAPTDNRHSPAREKLPDNCREALTRTGKPFTVSGSIGGGAEILPGKMRYPIKFPKSFMDDLLARFPKGEVAVGGSFGGPPTGSLGEFIQQKLPTKMNPAVYVAALLVEEGYAVWSRRGYIRFGEGRQPNE